MLAVSVKFYLEFYTKKKQFMQFFIKKSPIKQVFEKNNYKKWNKYIYFNNWKLNLLYVLKANCNLF